MTDRRLTQAVVEADLVGANRAVSQAVVEADLLVVGTSRLTFLVVEYDDTVGTPLVESVARVFVRWR